jgi:hypothetical protein
LGGQGGGVDARAGYDEHAQTGHLGCNLRIGVDQPSKQGAADAGAAYGDDVARVADEQC